MAQQVRGLRTRRRVQEAAAEVFAERGYEASTISDIIDRAGVTKGALYFHFPSKEALLRGVLDEQWFALRLPGRTCKLQEMTDVGMVLAHETPRNSLMRAGARLTTDPQLRRLFQEGPWSRWVRATTEILESARANGELLPHVNPAETAQFALGAWIGVQLTSQVNSQFADLTEQASVFYRHILPSIAVPAVLAQLDTSPERGAKVVAEMEAMPSYA